MKIALLFPGQGAQFVGMGRELAEQFPAARERFEEADALLGFSLSRLCWEGPAAELTRTENCQPALYVTSMAALAALESVIASRPRGGAEAGGEAISFPPAAAAGLSLGEYSALAAAGAFSFADGLRLVRLRGQAMEEASRQAPGAMASILGIEEGPLQEVCASTGAQVANLNSPGQIVISGSPEQVQAAMREAKEKGAKRAIPLEVGGAFHSRLMEPAAERLKAALASVEVKAPRFPVLSNVSGQAHGDPASIQDLLVRQLTQPVRWEACVRSLLGQGIRSFLEVGAGSVLKGLLRKIDPEAQVRPAGAPEEVRQAAGMKA